MIAAAKNEKSKGKIEGSNDEDNDVNVLKLDRQQEMMV